MPGPSIEQLAAMYGQQSAETGETMTDTTLTEPAAEVVKLDLQDQTIPHNSWQPLAEEISEDMPAKLIDALITYINKMDFPPRFKTAEQAYAYFGIMSEAQITRLNEIAEGIKQSLLSDTKPVAPVEAV